MELLVEFRLPLRQLDGDLQLVLLRLHDGVGALTLGAGHVLAELQHIVVVFHALGEEPAVDADHRHQGQPEHEDEAGISAPKIAPGSTSAIALTHAIGASSGFQT